MNGFKAILCAIALAWPLVEIKAQTLVDPAQEFLKEEKRRKDLERLQNSRAGQDIEVPGGRSAAKKDTTCFAIKRIELQGITKFGKLTTEPLIKPHKNSCMGQQAISELMQKITNLYVKKGYITTRAYIPEQDLASGTLKLLIIEGYVEAIEHLILESGEKKTYPAGTLKTITAFPELKGRIFNLRDVEQGLDQINRLMSSAASVDLKPGKKAGGSIIVITEKVDDRWRGYLGYDNNGSEITGRHRGRITLQTDDLFGINDSWSINLIGSQNSNVLAGSFSIPFGYWKFSGNASYSENQQGLTQTSELFSQTASTNLQLERLVYRDAKNKVRLSGALASYWNSRFINASELDPQKRGAFRFGIASEHHFPGSVVSLDFGFSKGLRMWFGPDDEPTLPGAPSVDFTKLDATVYWINAWEHIRLVVSASGQFTKSILLSPDQFVIGGWDTVRGYQGAEAGGDRGAYVRNELVFSLPKMGSAKSANKITDIYNDHIRPVEPFAFADAGMVWSLANDQEFRMAGVGGGFRYSAGRINFQLTAGMPLIEIFDLDARTWQSFANLSIKLF